MKRLTIDEVIEHCKRHTEKYEQFVFKGGRNLGRTELTKQYLEHKQVSEWLEELKQYRDLEEQGLLLKLPCKVGDTVYIVMRLHYRHDGLDMSQYKEIEETKVDNLTIDKPYWKINYDEHEFLPEDFGKTVFLTKEEAEAKLKELQN